MARYASVVPVARPRIGSGSIRIAERLLSGLIALAAVAGCGDDDPPGPGRLPGVLRIPVPYTFEEAARKAIPGDTLLVLFSGLPLSETVTIRSEQTPLRIEGNKTYPVLTGPTAQAGILRIVRPQPGTEVRGLAFSGGDPALSVSGPGEIRIHDTRFMGGGVQVFGGGSDLTLTVDEALMRDAGEFSIEVSGATLIARGNTIDSAGDCGILARDGATAAVTRSIFWRSLNYGIACLSGAALDTSGCNDVHASGVAAYLGCAAPATDFQADPQFCDPDRGIFSIASTSPCSPDSSEGCGLVGALPVGCDP